jgi:hypothetical protein
MTQEKRKKLRKKIPKCFILSYLVEFDEELNLKIQNNKTRK